MISDSSSVFLPGNSHMEQAIASVGEEAGLEHIEKLRTNLNQVICGKPDVVELLILAVLADGSVLMEDVPGVGKTLLQIFNKFTDQDRW